MNFEVDISSLTNLDPLTIFKTIISSADYFPGLYRFTTTWGNNLHQDQYLKLLGLLEIIHLTQRGRTWPKEEWLSAHQLFFQIGFNEASRNQERADQELAHFLKEKNIKWFSNPQKYALATIDINNPPSHIECNSSYYMMGSILHFSEELVRIGYDAYDKTSCFDLPVSFKEASHYIGNVFSEKTFSDLFFRSEIVGHLDFSDHKSAFKYNELQIATLMGSINLSSPIFATPLYRKKLPIQFAKLIGVTHVK